MKKLLKKKNEKVTTVVAYTSQHEKCNMKALYCNCGSQSSHTSLNNSNWQNAYQS